LGGWFDGQVFHSLLKKKRRRGDVKGLIERNNPTEREHRYKKKKEISPALLGAV